MRFRGLPVQFDRSRHGESDQDDIPYRPFEWKTTWSALVRAHCHTALMTPIVHHRMLCRSEGHEYDRVLEPALRLHSQAPARILFASDCPFPGVSTPLENEV